jgi:GR25 family glycosyltransferase involved in LPS biosynthesis
MFSSIWYLNLDRRPDRNQRVHAVLDASDLRDVPRQRVAAVDGSKLSDSDLRRLLTPVALKELYDVEHGSRLRKHHSQLTRGAVGCYLTHMQLWAELGKLTDDTGPVLVLEDDVGLPVNVGAVLASGLDAFLSTGTAGVPKLVLWTYMHCDHSGPAVVPDAPLVLLSRPWWSTQAYTLLPSTARALATHMDLARLDMQIDSALQFLGDLQVFGCSRVAMANDGSSNIQAHIVPGAPLYRAGKRSPQHADPINNTVRVANKTNPPRPPLPPPTNPVPVFTTHWSHSHPSPQSTAPVIWIVVIVIVLVGLVLGLGLGLGLGLKKT